MKVKNQQSGFTLVELVVVIVILGILSATALPKFINVSKDARISALNGVAGALRSGVSLVQAKYFATGSTTATTVQMQDGTTVAVAAGTGIPTAAGILSAISLDGFPAPTTSGTVVTFQPSSGGSSTCQVTYDASSGVVTPTTTDC